MAKEEKIAETSKEVVQSYLLTTAGRDWGIYAEKFLLKLVEAAQGDIQGMDFRKTGKDLKPHSPSLNYPGITKNSDGDVFISIPVRELLPSDDYKNYDYVRETIEQLQTKILRWEAPKLDAKGNVVYNEAGLPVRKWKSVQLVGEAEGETDLNSCITVRINTNIWTAMVDFTKGFRAFDLKIALKLQSKYSLRLYQLMSRQDQPLTFKIDDLKQQWNLEGKYTRVDDFIKRTIDPAKEELDAVSPYTFDYKVVKSNAPGRGQKPVNAITFYPKHQIQFENEKTIKGFDETQMLKEPVRRLLKDKFGFTWVEMSTTFDIFYTAQKTFTGADEDHPVLSVFLDRLTRRALDAKDPKKYVVSCVKKHLQEKYNIVYKSKKQLAAEEKARKALEKAAAQKKDSKPVSGPVSLGELLK